MRWSFPGAGTLRAWSCGHGLIFPFEGLLRGPLYVLCWQGRLVGQQWLIGALPVTPVLAPAESPVPPHQYACAHSEPLGTALGNFHGRCPPHTPDGMESGSVLVPFNPCTL